MRDAGVGAEADRHGAAAGVLGGRAIVPAEPRDHVGVVGGAVAQLQVVEGTAGGRWEL